MNNDIEREFNLGGSVEKALSGSYELKVGDVLKEAWGITVKHFINFTPAIFALILVQLAIFYFAFKLQIGDLRDSVCVSGGRCAARRPSPSHVYC